jgi:predicted XRE-type DNA-binding protein
MLTCATNDQPDTFVSADHRQLSAARKAGNVFADLGLPDADKLKIKSDMICGDFSNLSERKLMDCLNRLGYDIEIKVKPASDPVGHLMLAVA